MIPISDLIPGEATYNIQFLLQFSTDSNYNLNESFFYLPMMPLRQRVSEFNIFETRIFQLIDTLVPNSNVNLSLSKRSVTSTGS